jgi:uncharacterized protein involved in outer membrane biogenesis
MRWKRIAGIGVLLIITLVAAAYGILVSYDFNRLKPHVARLVKDITGRELRLGGDVHLAFGLVPSLVVNDIALANAAWGSQPQMITIDTLQLQFRLLPLLFRNIDIDQVSLSGGKVLLETGPGAQTNWQFTGRKAAGSTGVLKGVNVAVDRVRIANLDFTLRPSEAASQRQFTLTSLAMDRQKTEGVLSLDLRADYSGQAVTLDGTIGSIEQLLKRERFPVQLAARSSNIDLNISGAIEDLPAYKGLDLQLDGSGRDLSEIGTTFGQKLPATDQFAFKGHLTGSAKALMRADVQGSASRGSLRFVLNGTVQDLLALGGMDLASSISGRDLTAFGEMFGVKLPATDEFEIRGRLRGSTEKLALQSAQASTARGGMRLNLKGAVEDLLALGGMDLEARVAGKDLAAFGEMITVKLPATDEFEIQGRLRGSTKKLALQSAQAVAARGGMRVNLKGAVKDLLTLEGMDLQSRLTGSELAELGPLVGAELPDLGAFDIHAKLSGSPQAISLKPLAAVVDKSDFNGWATVAVRERPKVTVRLTSSVIDFTTLMKSFENDTHKPSSQKKQPQRLFSDEPLPLEVLAKVDADILLQATNIQARNAHLRAGYLTLKLEDRDLSIDKLEATYKGTKIAGDLQIRHGETPQVVTKFIVQQFNLGDFLKEIGKSDKVQAIIDIAAHGKSSGNSINGLMANLDGEIGAVMGEGFLTRYLDLLSLGLSEKVIQIWDPPKEAAQIKCAVVQFDIQRGVAASQAFVFDTRAGIIDGEGQIDLGTESINFLLVPKPRHPDLSFTPKLKVSGTITDPQVGVDKLALLTRSASALSALVVGPLGLLAPFVHLGAHNAHPCNVNSIGQSGLSPPAAEP